MRPICSIYEVARWVRPARVPPLSFLYVAIQQSGMLYPPSRLKCELSGVVRMQIASFTTNSIVRLACCSILVSPQWMAWSLFGYGRLVCKAFDASVLMFFQTCFESMCSLTDVHLSTGAWHFTDNVCLLLHREGVFDLTEERTEGGSRLEPHFDVRTHPPFSPH